MSSLAERAPAKKSLLGDGAQRRRRSEALKRQQQARADRSMHARRTSPRGIIVESFRPATRAFRRSRSNAARNDARGTGSQRRRGLRDVDLFRGDKDRASGLADARPPPPEDDRGGDDDAMADEPTRPAKTKKQRAADEARAKAARWTGEFCARAGRAAARTVPKRRGGDAAGDRCLRRALRSLQGGSRRRRGGATRIFRRDESVAARRRGHETRRGS